MSYRAGLIQKRLLILLYGALSLGLSYTPRQRSAVFAAINKEWSYVREESIRQAIRSLYKNKMISIKESPDGKIALGLLEKGRVKVLEYKLDDINIIRPATWDGHWRLVIFDIPKSKKKIREAFRKHLNRLGFYQYQKSVFIFPYHCKNEADFLIEFYQIRKYVRQLEVAWIDDDLGMRKIFSSILGKEHINI